MPTPPHASCDARVASRYLFHAEIAVSFRSIIHSFQRALYAACSYQFAREVGGRGEEGNELILRRRGHA
jgi:hypothetical protein